ncbi:HD domain-containing phosphohydrolase [uncultured Thiodictyon sp.]|uniref:HD domain-containing phosphohydrolase n=1 Tax=uncultured Thiodictyon sp. TaxID=1846217 RepID=UPI0025E8741A|nr:HD domain-containing phosphohydrolase [uncultured Thiodictyon sp.]
MQLPETEFFSLDISQSDSPPEPKRQACLIPQTGSAKPFALDAPQCVVGREETADYFIADRRASRRHAKVLALHNRYYVQDLGSRNGTYLNGHRIENERLAHGDLIMFGGTVFRFEMGTDLDATYLKKLNLDTVTSLAEAVDKKDPYTGSHSLAVSKVAERIALALGLDQAAAERVRIAGRLHDIGKIGVPDAVLRKPAPLTEAEFALIRKHPADGASILSPLEFLIDILPGIRQHHERFDGRGYPDGVSGTAIALEARIIQVADTYHAMASNRPYRHAQPLEFIRAELIRHAGTQFDPDVIQALLDILFSVHVAN